ncbi:MAG: hypothetical protein EKK57_07920 [Proteobacteria bacterium]|nr:MAG: hypothetical protein EKK57_07920 [Pseudomonadota bacterium]
MAKLVGFEQVIKPFTPKAVYKSTSKGPLVIEDMATKHIENALRGRLISVFVDMLRGKSFDEMLTQINTLYFSDFMLESDDVANLYNELSKRNA